jgi:hypothetical protein
MIMRDLWIKIGCFITGHNYAIVKNSSEASSKAVKKYLSAILIVATLWGFIGYAFTSRYLHGNPLVSAIGALVMVIIVIQVERQIILSVGKNKLAFAFRVAIGIVMAIIGSVILDQVMFKEDVEKHKIENVQLKVNEILPLKTRELTSQINQLDSAIRAKEAERALILADYNKNPMISAPSVTGRFEKDSSSGQMVEVGRVITTNSIQNPKAELIVQLDAQLKAIQEQKAKKENEMLNARQLLEDDLNSKVGFLDELTILFSLLLSSGIALTVWILLFFFFLSIELFVLVNKYGDTVNDYDKTIIHQMALKIQMLENLQEQQGIIKK